ncbi:MAG: hypothetical protein K6F28_11110 [Lachnospiraceae bacterium]|nr:hypothetical protein [Lachnospiraceae bacterium]
MDREEERVLYLTRVGREKIFKYGTYNVVQERPITQDHPFYVKRDDVQPHVPGFELTPGYGEAAPAENTPVMEAVAGGPVPEPAHIPENAMEDDPAAMASQIISGNFKVGLSQEEVDALLNGMN